MATTVTAPDSMLTYELLELVAMTTRERLVMVPHKTKTSALARRLEHAGFLHQLGFVDGGVCFVLTDAGNKYREALRNA